MRSNGSGLRFLMYLHVHSCITWSTPSVHFVRLLLRIVSTLNFSDRSTSQSLPNSQTTFSNILSFNNLFHIDKQMHLELGCSKMIFDSQQVSVIQPSLRSSSTALNKAGEFQQQLWRLESANFKNGMHLKVDFKTGPFALRGSIGHNDQQTTTVGTLQVVQRPIYGWVPLHSGSNWWWLICVERHDKAKRPLVCSCCQSVEWWIRDGVGWNLHNWTTVSHCPKQHELAHLSW